MGLGGILAELDWEVFLALVREWKVVLPELGQSLGAVRCFHQIGSSFSRIFIQWKLWNLFCQINGVVGNFEPRELCQI